MSPSHRRHWSQAIVVLCVAGGCATNAPQSFDHSQERHFRPVSFTAPTRTTSLADTDTSAPLPSFWDTLKRDVKSAPADLWRDTKVVYTSESNLLILGLAYGGSLAIQATGVDDSIADSMQDHGVFHDDFNIAVGTAGNPLAHLGVAGLWYLVGQQRGDDETYRIGKTLFRALIINDLSNATFKLAASDTGPNGERYAFPSGHVSSTFTIASVLHQAYGPWVGVPLYGLGALVAVGRIDTDEHHLSDVVMGSIMGLVIGHTVAGGKPIEVAGGRIIPYTDPGFGATGIAWHRRF